MKTVEFIKRPQFTDIITVYQLGSHYFGRCKGTKFVQVGSINREIAIVELAERSFRLSECDFCFESEKVELI